MINKKQIIFNTLVLILILFTTSGAEIKITLEKAQQIAEEHSPDMKKLKLNIEQYTENLLAQRAGLKTSLSLSLNPFEYSQSRRFNTMFNLWNTTEELKSSGDLVVRQKLPWTDGQLFFTNSLSWQDSYSEYTDSKDKSFHNNMYISYSQPFFTYNRTKLQLEELGLQLRQSTLTYAIQKLSMELNVSQYFYNVYKAKTSLDISREEFENTKANYEMKEEKVAAGIAAKEELYQAEISFVQSKGSMQSAEVSLDNAKDEFKKNIGLPIDEEISLDSDILLFQERVDVDLKMAIDHALKNRLELEQDKIDLIYQQNNLIEKQSENEFKGNFRVDLGLIGTDKDFGTMYAEPTQNKGVTFTLEIPVFDWGEKKHKINAQKVAIESQKISMKQQQEDIIIVIRRRWRELANSLNQITLNEKQVASSLLTYDLNLERYESGDLTGMELNQYQTQLSTAKQSLVDAQISYQLQLLQLKIETLYDFKRQTPVIPDIQEEK